MVRVFRSGEYCCSPDWMILAGDYCVILEDDCGARRDTPTIVDGKVNPAMVWEPSGDTLLDYFEELLDRGTVFRDGAVVPASPNEILDILTEPASSGAGPVDPVKDSRQGREIGEGDGEMATFLEELAYRDDEDDDEAVLYEFGRSRRRAAVKATTLESAWRGLEVRGYDTDEWVLLRIGGSPVEDR